MNCNLLHASRPKFSIFAVAAAVLGKAASMHAASIDNLVSPLSAVSKAPATLITNAGHLVQPNAAAPEPSTWALLFVGAAILGFYLRRQRRRLS